MSKAPKKHSKSSSSSNTSSPGVNTRSTSRLPQSKRTRASSAGSAPPPKKFGVSAARFNRTARTRGSSASAGAAAARRSGHGPAAPASAARGGDHRSAAQASAASSGDHRAAAVPSAANRNAQGASSASHGSPNGGGNAATADNDEEMAEAPPLTSVDLRRLAQLEQHRQQALADQRIREKILSQAQANGQQQAQLNAQRQHQEQREHEAKQHQAVAMQQAGSQGLTIAAAKIRAENDILQRLQEEREVHERRTEFYSLNDKATHRGRSRKRHPSARKPAPSLDDIFGASQEDARIFHVAKTMRDQANAQLENLQQHLKLQPNDEAIKAQIIEQEQVKDVSAREMRFAVDRAQAASNIEYIFPHQAPRLDRPTLMADGSFLGSFTIGSDSKNPHLNEVEKRKESRKRKEQRQKRERSRPTPKFTSTLTNSVLAPQSNSVLQPTGTTPAGVDQDVRPPPLKKKKRMPKDEDLRPMSDDETPVQSRNNQIAPNAAAPVVAAPAGGRASQGAHAQSSGGDHGQQSQQRGRNVMNFGANQSVRGGTGSSNHIAPQQSAGVPNVGTAHGMQPVTQGAPPVQQMPSAFAQPQMPGAFNQSPMSGAFNQPQSSAPSQPQPMTSRLQQQQQQIPSAFTQPQMSSAHSQVPQHNARPFMQPHPQASVSSHQQQQQHAQHASGSANAPLPQQCGSSNAQHQNGPNSVDLREVLAMLQSSNLPADEVLSMFTAISQARSCSAPPPQSRNSDDSPSGFPSHAHPSPGYGASCASNGVQSSTPSAFSGHQAHPGSQQSPSHGINGGGDGYQSSVSSSSTGAGGGGHGGGIHRRTHSQMFADTSGGQQQQQPASSSSSSSQRNVRQRTHSHSSNDGGLQAQNGGGSHMHHFGGGFQPHSPAAQGSLFGGLHTDGTNGQQQPQHFPGAHRHPMFPSQSGGGGAQQQQHQSIFAPPTATSSSSSSAFSGGNGSHQQGASQQHPNAPFQQHSPQNRQPTIPANSPFQQQTPFQQHPAATQQQHQPLRRSTRRRTHAEAFDSSLRPRE